MTLTFKEMFVVLFDNEECFYFLKPAFPGLLGVCGSFTRAHLSGDADR